MFQQEVIMAPKYYKLAYGKIDKLGALWDHPPTYMKNGKNPLQKSWIDFVRLHISGWIPTVLIGDNSWKASCQKCGKVLSKNGNCNPPRLVFDQYDTYWLNAPNRYICLTCRNSNGMIQNENGKLTNSSRSMSPEIMNQIQISHPKIYDLFLYHLIRKIQLTNI